MFGGAESLRLPRRVRGSAGALGPYAKAVEGGFGLPQRDTMSRRSGGAFAVA